MSRLDVEICIAAEENTTLLTHLVEAFLLLGLQQNMMETREKAFEERMETLREKMLAMTEGFQEQTSSLEGEIVSLK